MLGVGNWVGRYIGEANYRIGIGIGKATDRHLNKLRVYSWCTNGRRKTLAVWDMAQSPYIRGSTLYAGMAHVVLLSLYIVPIHWYRNEIPKYMENRQNKAM